jgi:hypothetical protein
LEYGGQGKPSAAKKRQAKTAKDRAAFFAQKYGDTAAKNSAAEKMEGDQLMMKNKFSLSRVEWLEAMGL